MAAADRLQEIIKYLEPAPKLFSEKYFEMRTGKHYFVIQSAFLWISNIHL
jgi:hypothetical protein